jgi:hypothetical protein
MKERMKSRALGSDVAGILSIGRSGWRCKNRARPRMWFKCQFFGAEGALEAAKNLNEATLLREKKKGETA